MRPHDPRPPLQACRRGQRARAAGGRVRTLAAAVALVCLGNAAPLCAGIDGSQHDLSAQWYDVKRDAPSQALCSRCHLPSHRSSQAPPLVPRSLADVWGEKSLVCFSCHDGTTIVSPAVDASMTAFHPRAHGLRLADDPSLDWTQVPLPALEGGRMDCVTCHNPHDNALRPFLRADLQELCKLCHPQRVSLEGAQDAQGGGGAESGGGGEIPFVNHPQGVGILDVEEGRAPLSAAPAFMVPFPSPYPLQGGRDAPGTHWDLGGHLSQGGEGTVGCPTCHTVHGDETTAPAVSLLALDPVRKTADLFCEGCHSGSRGDSRPSPPFPNPGATVTGRTYHPCDEDAANGEGLIVEAPVPPGWTVGVGAPPRILCSTCHVPHGAAAGTQILRAPKTATTFCESCHKQAPEYHHPVTLEGKCGRRMTGPADGVATMGCDSCHRAHNAGLGFEERRFVPLLREEWGDESCARCHPPENPTCGEDPEKRASHFIGSPAEEYDDLDPPLHREPWPESGLYSRYSGADGNSVTCLSCHSFEKGWLVSGDANTGRFLLARSGNPVEWQEDKLTTYLCTGCHSASPGTGEQKGHSHPTMRADVTKLLQEIPVPLSGTPSGHMNCDSCHRPHEAMTRGGYYILEQVDGLNDDPRAVHPQIDFTSLCHLCHGEATY